MTANFNKITAQYSAADFNRRLHMYLEYPGLRPDFIRIDQKDLEKGLAAGFKSRKNLPLAQTSMVLSLVATCAKKIFGVTSA